MENKLPSRIGCHVTKLMLNFHHCNNVDANVERILRTDGVDHVNVNEPNQEQINIPQLIEKYGRSQSWSHTLVNTACNSATLIAQLPGEGNREHYHPDWDEWWYIVEGEWDWRIEGTTIRVHAGDVIFIERNRTHQISATGTKMAIRLAVSRYDVAHHFV